MKQRILTAATNPLEVFRFSSRRQRRAISTLKQQSKPMTPLEVVVKPPKNPFFSRMT
jgi:hypothetical protein